MTHRFFRNRFSAGPWLSKKNNHGISFVDITDMKGKIIAVMPDRTDEDRKNIHLVMAATKLVDGLQELLNGVIRYEEENGEGILPVHIAEAKEILSQARGEKFGQDAQVSNVG